MVSERIQRRIGSLLGESEPATGEHDRDRVSDLAQRVPAVDAEGTGVRAFPAVASLLAGALILSIRGSGRTS